MQINEQSIVIDAFTNGAYPQNAYTRMSRPILRKYLASDYFLARSDLIAPILRG